MARWMKARAALCAAGMGWAMAAAAETVAAPAEASAPAGVARELCDAVAEGLSLLADNRLAPPVDGAAKAALLEALIRASEPSATFLDEADLAWAQDHLRWVNVTDGEGCRKRRTKLGQR